MRAENGSRSRDLKAVARTASLTGEFRGCWHPEGLARQVRKLPAVVAARCVQLAGQYGECTVEDRHASRVPTSLERERLQPPHHDPRHDRDGCGRGPRSLAVQEGQPRR
jgi:hypothetical protein